MLATAAGAALVERGRRLPRDAEDAIDLVQRHAQGRVGKVRLGTSTGVVVHLLPRMLEALALALALSHSGIDVEVSVLGSVDTMQRLAARQLEIGIVALPQAGAAELPVTRWRSDPMMAFLPLAWEAPEAVTPVWLAERPLVFNDSGTRMYRLTMEWFGQAGLDAPGRTAAAGGGPACA